MPDKDLNEKVGLSQSLNLSKNDKKDEEAPRLPLEEEENIAETTSVFAQNNEAILKQENLKAHENCVNFDKQDKEKLATHFAKTLKNFTTKPPRDSKNKSNNTINTNKNNANTLLSFEDFFSNHTLKPINKSTSDINLKTNSTQPHLNTETFHEDSEVTHDSTPRVSIQSENKKVIKTRHPFRRLGIFFIVLMIGIIIGYKILLKGIAIESLHIANITIHNIFLQFNSKLVLQIDKIDASQLSFLQNTESTTKPFTEIVQNIITYTQRSLYALSYFNTLEIHDIVLGDNHIKITYNNTNYELITPMFDANFSIINNQNNLYLKIEQFQFKHFPLHLEGDFIFSIPQKQLFFDITAIKEDTKQSKPESLSLKGSTDFQTIHANGSSTDLSNLDIIKPLIQSVQKPDLRATLNGWIFEKVKYSSLKITEITMNLELDNLANSLLKKMVVKASIQKPEVTLNKGVTPILGKEVLLEFKDANLLIIPIQATFADMDLNNSEVLIANMPLTSVYVTLHGKDIRLDSNLQKLLLSYGVSIPVKQVLQKKPKDSKQAVSTTQEYYVKAENKSNEYLYQKVLELNPNTTLTDELLRNPQYSDKIQTTSMKLQISIEHNKKQPKHSLFSLQGIIQAKNIDFNLYEIPLNADTLNVMFDITPKQRNIYVNGNRVKWQKIADADINLNLDINKHTIQANTAIHQVTFNNENLQALGVMRNLSSDNTPTQDNSNQTPQNPQNTQNTQNPQNPNSQTLDSNTTQNDGIYLQENLAFSDKLQNLQRFGQYDIMPVKLAKNTQKEQKNTELSQEEIAKLPTQDIKDNGDIAKKDEKVLKTLKNNPIWNDLKIRTKQTRPFTPLTNQELKELAMQQIENDKKPFAFKQDFLNIKNTNIQFNLSFASDTIILEIPSLSLHIESNKDLLIKVAKLENILQFSPFTRYYGITHGDFTFQTHHADKHNVADFVLNLTHLQHPLYTTEHQRVSELTLNGKVQDNALIIIVNDNIDFKSQDSLSMLRIKGYRVDIDEMYNSKIPFFIDLLKDRKKDDLPYSEAAIRQELRFIAIKNQLRKQLKINPFDFNVIGENLQLTFLGYTLPFDSANIRFIDDQIIIDGQYGRGIANINVVKDNISVKAKNFSGDYVNIVLTSAKNGKKMIQGGNFSVDALYRDGILNASMEVSNTAILEFQAIQNIFALIDTVPSLFMFKNPHMSTTGYQVSFGKILFAINSDYVGLQNIFLLGNTMDINGQGIIDINTQEMNVNLNISTIKNLSKFINKIPVLGYLILGREGQINTNLILTGKYYDPKVNITLATDIIMAPINILRRVFTVDMIIDSLKTEEEAVVDY